MKKKFTLLLMVTGFLFKMNSQVQFYEGFTAPFNPAASGWDVQNQSSSIGTNINGWDQGNSAVIFSAISGTADDFFSSDINATSSAGTTNTISCWLITPTLNLVNGAFLEFATRQYRLPVTKADRIQVYYSIGTGTNVGTGPGTATNTAGTFTNIIYDLNPTMNAMGYFNFWWVVTTSLTGIPSPTVGRLAFRYYVPDGGAAGPNGNAIGIDEVRYSLPCQKPRHFGDQNDFNAPACAGLPLKLGFTNVTPAVPITSYTWFTGATTNTINYTMQTPGMMDVWSLSESTPGCVSLDISTIFAYPPPIVTYTLNPASGVLCAGQSVTVEASGANTYTYTLGANSSATFNPISLVTPTVASATSVQFTVSGKSNFGCINRQVITLTVNPKPVLTVAQTKSVSCVNSNVTFTASGASSYTWNVGTTSSTMNPVTYTTGNTATVRQYSVTGVSAQGCTNTAVRTVTVSFCTGIDEAGDDAASILYPNPFNEQLNIKDFTGELKMYNQVGQLVMDIKVEAAQSINTTDLPPGIYTIKTNSDTGTGKTTRLIKQ